MTLSSLGALTQSIRYPQIPDQKVHTTLCLHHDPRVNWARKGRDSGPCPGVDPLLLLRFILLDPGSWTAGYLCKPLAICFSDHQFWDVLSEKTSKSRKQTQQLIPGKMRCSLWVANEGSSMSHPLVYRAQPPAPGRRVLPKTRKHIMRRCMSSHEDNKHPRLHGHVQKDKVLHSYAGKLDAAFIPLWLNLNSSGYSSFL